MAIRFLSGQTIDGTLTVSGNVQGATFNGLAINTSLTNNVANQIVRTQANGYVNFGWINSVSGNHTGSITRITASNDAYLRYVTPAQFRTGVTDGYYAPVSTVSGVTSVATGNGLTGGTIISTGTLSMSGSYSGTFTSTAVATDNIITSAGSLVINNPLDQNSNLIIAGRYDLGSTTLSFRSGHGGNANVWEMATIHVEDDSNYNGRIMFKTSPASYGNTPTTKMTIRSSGAIAFGTGISDYGSSGQILKSNGNTSPTWVDASTVIGGPYVTLGTAQTITASKTFSTLTYFTAGESINLKGARGTFTNEFMRLYNKVGIGNPAGWGQGETSTPNQGLSTYGAGYFAYGTRAASTFLGDLTVSKGTPIIKALDGTNNHYLFIAADTTNSFMRSDNNLLLQVDGGNVTALTFDNVGSATFSGYTYFPNYLFHAGDTNTRIFFETGKITLRGDTNIILTGGNVGIGDTSPDYRLTVAKTSIAAPAFMVSGAYYGGPRIQTYGLDADPNAWMGLGTDMSGGAYEHNIYFSDTGSLGRLSIGTYNGTTYSEKMCVLRTGNVGIGTASPVSELQVGDYMAKNTVTIGGFYAAGGGVLAFRSGYAPNPAYVWNTAEILATDDGSFNGRIEFKTSTVTRAAPTIKMVLKANGKLGINTTTPDELVDITGGYLKFNGGDYGLKGSASLTYNPVSDHYFMANGSTKVVFKASGNVGINTTNPLNKLHVDGNVQIGGWTTAGSRYVGTARIDNGSWTNGAAGMEVESVTESGQGNYDQKVHLISHRYNGGTSRVLTASFTTANNRVGIGDATPSYTLDVAGTIRATGDVIAYSDARVKDNVKTIDNALEKVTKLRGVSYTRNDIEDKSTKIGVIAQEVLKVLPEVVSQDENDKYSVSYGNITGVLIEAIKELKQEIEELKKHKCNCKE